MTAALRDAVTTTRRALALGHDFAVRSDDPTLTQWLDGVLAPLATPGAAAVFYDLRRVGSDRWTLRCDDEVVCAATDAAHALAMLLWHVNQRAVASAGDLVLLHAAGVVADGIGVVLPAAAESGKSTLAAALVRAGFDYLSDEVVALEPGTLAVRPYPKALSLDVGSQGVLADLAPHVPAALRGRVPAQWQVPADHIRAGSVAADGVVPRLLVFPRYVAGAATTLTPVSRADALLAAAASTFRYGEAGARDVEVLGALVRACACFDLVVDDLDAACAALAGLVARLDRLRQEAVG